MENQSSLASLFLDVRLRQDSGNSRIDIRDDTNTPGTSYKSHELSVFLTMFESNITYLRKGLLTRPYSSSIQTLKADVNWKISYCV